MLRLTKKADYGLMALKYLAEHPGEASLSAKDIAEAYHIPPQLLAKILQQLAREGLLQSHAGMNGGYTDRKSTRLNSSHQLISYAVFCLQKKSIRGQLPGGAFLNRRQRGLVMHLVGR